MCTAFTLGAKVLEKHFTLNKKIKGNDHYHSMDSKDLAELKKNLSEIIEFVGSGSQIKKPIKSELRSRIYARRCIAAKFNLKKGTTLNEKNLITLRPNIGISSEKWKFVIGKRLKRDINALEKINLTDITNLKNSV